MERITGPFMGHYVAAYAMASDEGYVGYAKICAETPANVWQCEALDKVGVPPQASLSLAMEAAEKKAWMFLSLLLEYYFIDIPF